MKLSENFVLSEFTNSNTATRLNIDNTPDSKVMENLIYLAKELEDVRRLFNNNPITISSGYRSILLNDTLKSRRTSQHIQGLAIDFTCNRYGSPDRLVEVLFKSEIPYDQCILEFGNWVHLSFPGIGKKPRRQTLVINKKGVKNYVGKQD